ncbi:MAG: tetratricopeptide repeat protein [Acidobacteriota bacterium]|nr:tetratricopeptide repeat protein [Acidobacteriota bacterium]
MKFAPTLLLCLLAIPVRQSVFAQPDDLALKSQQAKNLMAEGKFADAIPLYVELNQALPNNPGLMLNLGMALHMAGQEQKAVAQLEVTAKLDPTLEPAWLFLGAARLQMHKAPAAVDALKTALRLQPDNRGALEMLAGALLSLDRSMEAAEQYSKLTILEPESSKAWHGLGQSYESLSARAFDRLQKTAPESGYLLALLADARLREQQLSSAYYLYRRALEKMPAMRGLHESVAEIYRQTAHPDWADAEAKKERELLQPDCRSQLLECDFQAGRYTVVVASTEGARTAESYYWRTRAYNELALQAFSRLGQLPPSAEQHELKARIYDDQKRYSEAAGEWREALKLSPGDPQAEKQLAISLKFSQDYGGALPLFQDILRRQPGSAELNFLTGDTLLDLHRADEAIPFLRRSVLHDPKMIMAHKSLARAYLATGKSAEAVPHLKLALPTDADGSLHYQLAKAYEETGRAALSKSMLEEYQKIQAEATAAKDASKIEITAP